VDDYLPQATISGDTKQGHERNTLVLKGLVVFAVALFGVGILVEYGLGFVMRDFSREEKGLEALAPPTFPDDSGPFPGPRLQAEPSTEFQKMRKTDLGHLNGYGWVDRKAGIAHIPIDRAMEIVARSGLPSAVGSGAPASAASPEAKPLPPEAGKPAGPEAKQDKKP
jgi:hypothetical protein